jgi:serine/threonine protein phosphatase PrpC
LLTQSLGTDKMEIAPQIRRETLADGDKLLLCTDGLSDQIGEEDIVAELARGSSPQATCEALLERALAAGGKDNVTVAMAEYRIGRGN